MGMDPFTQAIIGAGISAVANSGGSSGRGARAPGGAGQLINFNPSAPNYADPTGGDFTQTALNMAGPKYMGASGGSGIQPSGQPIMDLPGLLNSGYFSGAPGPNGWRTGLLGSDFNGGRGNGQF